MGKNAITISNLLNREIGGKSSPVPFSSDPTRKMHNYVNYETNAKGEAGLGEGGNARAIYDFISLHHLKNYGIH